MKCFLFDDELLMTVALVRFRKWLVARGGTLVIRDWNLQPHFPTESGMKFSLTRVVIFVCLFGYVALVPLNSLCRPRCL